MHREISNDELMRERMPDAQDHISKIETFALTFNGYKYWGDQCGAIANLVSQYYDQHRNLPEEMAMSDLRACLFFEQRRLRNMGAGGGVAVCDKIIFPDPEPVIDYMRYLLQRIANLLDLEERRRKIKSLQSFLDHGIISEKQFAHVSSSLDN